MLPRVECSGSRQPSDAENRFYHLMTARTARPKNSRAGEDMEILEPSHSVGRNTKWQKWPQCKEKQFVKLKARRGGAHL